MNQRNRFEDLPERFRRHCYASEYCKRSTPDEAKQKFDELTYTDERMINATEFRLIDWRYLAHKERSVKQKRYKIDKGVPGPTDSTDSDNSAVSSEQKNEMNELKTFYNEAAELELDEMGETIRMRDVFRVMTIHRIAPNIVSENMRLPFNSLQVSIGYRNIIFKIGDSGTDEAIEVVYMSKNGGSLIQCEGTVYNIKKTKYQTLAAKDFFFDSK